VHEFPEAPDLQIRYYDTTDALLMALQAGEIDAIQAPKSTADYLCATNDRLVQPSVFNFPESDAFVQSLLALISDGYAFMMLEANADLRDQFDQAIADMKADGTLDALVLKHIAEASRTGETEAIAFEQFEGDPIRVAVTGALPPMDYVAPDGSFAGFNTAILAEIGRRLQKNIALKQVDSVGRALALAEGTVDVVFWTRGVSEGSVERHKSMTDEEIQADIDQRKARQTEEQNAVMKSLVNCDLEREKVRLRDMPEGTVCTDPYYTDYPVLVIMK
jgi:ABC-type amino acid transport substrate-binding protein